MVRSLFAYRHFYCSKTVQEKVWRQLAEVIRQEDPDLCCSIEIEQTAFHVAHFCQLEDIAGESYPFFDIENKYGQASWLYYFPLTRGKSSAFLVKQKLPYEKIYFSHGTKKLIYKISLATGITLFFAHFSLHKKTRQKQLQEVRQLISDTPGEVIFLGDFNMLGGFQELAPLLHQNDLVLSSHEKYPTFTFHFFKKVLDICICTKILSHEAICE